MIELIKSKFHFASLRRKAEAGDEDAQREFMLSVVRDARRNPDDACLAFKYARKFYGLRDHDGIFAYSVCLYEGIVCGSSPDNKNLADCYLSFLIMSQHEPSARYVLDRHDDGDLFFDFTIAQGAAWGAFSQYDGQYAVSLAKAAIKRNEAWGFCFMAERYKVGLDVVKDEQKADEYLSLAEGMPDGVAIVAMSRYHLAKFADGDTSIFYPLFKPFEDVRGFYADVLKAYLAEAYIYGYGVEQNYSKAIELLEMSYEAMPVNPFADYLMSICYHFECGFERNDRMALEYALKSSDFNIGLQEFVYTHIAELLLSGVGIEHDFEAAQRYAGYVLQDPECGMAERAKQIYDEASKAIANAQMIQNLRHMAEQGDADAMGQLGHRLLYGIDMPKDFNEAHQWLDKAVDAGHEDSKAFLGIIYRFGVGVDKDPQRAIDYFNQVKAAFYLGYLQLGQMYQYGDGVEQNPEKAFEYYIQGYYLHYHPSLEFNLGCCYVYGIGVEVDAEKGVQHLHSAADKDDSNACLWYGSFRLHGDNVEKDVDDGFSYLARAAQQGNLSAIYTIGRASLQEEGHIDPQHAFKCFEYAASRRHLDSIYQLGICYKEGIGVEADISKAVHYIADAAHNGHVDAQLEMASINYDLNGHGDMSYEWTFKWNKRAADQGSLVGQFRMALCYKDGIGVERNIDKAIEILMPMSKCDDEQARQSACELLQQIM